MVRLFQKKTIPAPLSLRAFHEKRNTILVIRDAGGLGDIIMHRMIFEDMKRVMPDAKIVWAVPPDYTEAASGHPFVDEVVDSKKVNVNDYVISYVTTTACSRHEHLVGPNSDKHRSDIWANHCGVILKSHNAHLTLSDEIVAYGKKRLAEIGTPVVVLCPISAMVGKNLTNEQMTGVSKRLLAKGMKVVALHREPIDCLTKIGVPTIWGVSIRQWMGIINAADYVISVDTAAFHCAGVLRKPVTAVYSFFDGIIYGSYYDFVLVQKHRANGDWDCGPCFYFDRCPKCPSNHYPKPCISELSVDMIMAGVDKMIEKWPVQNSPMLGK